MFAMNSDLYFEETESSVGLLLDQPLGLLHLLVLALDLAVLVGEQGRLLGEVLVRLVQLLLARLELLGLGLRLLEQLLRDRLASTVLSTSPMLSVS